MIVNNERIPPVEISESFVYLGKEFSFSMSNDEVKNSIQKELNEYLDKIDRLPIKPLNKIDIITKYVFSKFKWRFSIYKLTETWVEKNIDNIISRFIRKWLQLPISANISHLKFRRSRLGINYNTAKDIYQQCKLSVRRILFSSKNEEIKKFHNVTTKDNVCSDEIIALNQESYNSRSACSKTLKKRIEDSSWDHFMGLSEQNKLIKHLINSCTGVAILNWQKMINYMCSNIFNFSRRALILSLSNASNTYRWKITPSPNCRLCSKLQTQLHVFSYCKAALKRYTWRHDSILNTISFYLQHLNQSIYDIYIDIPNDHRFRNPALLFTSQRPDIVINTKNRMIVIELTVPYETNSKKSREYKKDRYQNLKENLVNQVDLLEIHFLEITSLGFITKDIKTVKKLFNSLFPKKDTERLLLKCSEVALRATFFIYCRRDKDWNNPELLSFI